MDNSFDKLFYHHGKHIGGIDETGVSDIAGPLIAACVILPRYDVRPDDIRILEVDDSKKIAERFRKKVAEVIWQCAIGIGIGEVTPMEFDALGQESSIRLAMLRSVASCRAPGTNKPIRPDFLMVDQSRGAQIPTRTAQKSIADGDEKSLCIAAASVIAKVYRDDYMANLHQSYPFYDWASNKGYASNQHLDGLDQHGFQIGIHRLRRWPFMRGPNEDLKESPMEWSRRRRLWRQLTMKKLQTEAGEEQWTSKHQSFQVSSKSKALIQKAL